MSSWEDIPEIVCHNATSAQIGHAHGIIAADRIRTNIANYAKLYLETADLTWQQARACAWQYVEPLKQSVPEIVEEMAAIASAANLDFIDIVTLNVRSEISLTNYSDGCTTVGQSWSMPKDGNNNNNSEVSEVFVGQNWDWVGETAGATVLFDIQRTGGLRIRMFGEAGIVGKFGFNSCGLGICMNAIRSGCVNVNKLPVHIAERKILECATLQDAVDVLERRGVASCVHFCIADSTGALASFECSPMGITKISPDDEGTVCHTNHLYAPHLPRGLVDHPARNSFSRLKRIQELSRGQAPSFESIRGRMKDEQGSPVSICRSAPAGAVGMERMETLCTIIMDLKARKAEITLGRPSLNPPVRVLTV